MPEPFLGTLDSQPAAVFLALNPGGVNTAFQLQGGIFPNEIRLKYGSYSKWAASWPYLRDPWVTEVGPNRHHRARLAFMRNWLGDESMDQSRMVSFELYPWHGTSITAAMRPPADIVRKWIWEPVAELGAPVFAFGRPWFHLLENEMGFRAQPLAGYGSAVASRRVTIFRDESTGVEVIAEKHRGSAGPPSAPETTLLRDALRIHKLHLK